MAGKKIQEISFTKMELNILKYLFKHYEDRYTPRQLARILSFNHAHINRLCFILTEKNLLLKEDIGNSNYYRFSYKDALAINFMEYLLSLEKKEFPEWLKVLLHSLNEFEPHLYFGCVFGSSILSRNYNDIDVLLVYDFKKAKDIKKIKGIIRRSDLIEKPIRYLDISYEDILKNKEDKVFYKIISDCMVFSHPENYVRAIKDAAA